MTIDRTDSGGTTSRDFTVAVFVVDEGRVLLHLHPKLGKWLPPGGHIEVNELPDDAARREVLEETGLVVDLVGERGLPHDYPGQPRQLIVPAGIQLESISPGHEHIDLVYFARVRDGGQAQLAAGFQWLSPAEIDSMPVPDEVRDWCVRSIGAFAR